MDESKINFISLGLARLYPTNRSKISERDRRSKKVSSKEIPQLKIFFFEFFGVFHSKSTRTAWLLVPGIVF
jgi:hypothetical protein